MIPFRCGYGFDAAYTTTPALQITNIGGFNFYSTHTSRHSVDQGIHL